MSYKDFEQGIPGSGLQKWKEREARERLRREMTSRWQESERILGIRNKHHHGRPAAGSVQDSLKSKSVLDGRFLKKPLSDRMAVP